MFWPDKHGKQREYKFGVITETVFGKTVKEQAFGRTRAGLRSYFHIGQIVIFEVTGGTPPMEVGPQRTPEDELCGYELFGTMNKAIDKANAVWGIDA